MKQQINYSLAEQTHNSAVRWERVRAAWFTRIGKHDNATRCKLIAAYHKQAAKDAAAGIAPTKRNR
jgi:hypothetical protein